MHPHGAEGPTSGQKGGGCLNAYDNLQARSERYSEILDPPFRLVLASAMWSLKWTMWQGI
ncbi:MAG: hypothetical protein R2788_18990 [Saprospiraceae bacterium]